MATTNQTGTYLRLIPALDGWSEMVLVASVEMERLLSNPEKMPVPGVTTYQQCSSLMAGEFSAKYKNYIFLKPSNLDPRADYLTFNFGAPKGTPNAPFRTKSYTDDWSWDMVIRDLEVVINSAFPQSTQNASGGVSFANRLNLRMDAIPAIERGSLFLRREYLGTSAFKIPRMPVPVPGMINIDYLGLTERFPSSLHDSISIPDQQAVIATLGGTAQPGGLVNGATYPATNFKRWRPYIYPDHQDQIDSGFWYRINLLIIPPRVPATIRLN